MAKQVMATVVMVLLGGTFAALFVLVLLNRASPAVVNAAVPVAVGAISAIALVFMFNRPESISRVFRVAFVVERESLLPIVIPHRPFPDMSLALADQMGQIDSTLFVSGADRERFDYIQPLYHEFLHKIFVDLLASRQFGTWRVKSERFQGFEQWGPTADASNYESKVLTTEQLVEAFGKNRFARVHSMFGKWALPPGTKLQIEGPHSDPQRGETGAIQLDNRFVRLTIRTLRSMSVVGLGRYSMLAAMPQEEAQQKYWTLEFIVRTDATFPWYLIGHPKTPVHREWASSVLDELTHAFDEDVIWRNTTESFMLHQHLPRTGEERPRTLGPIRSVKPAGTKTGSSPTPPPVK